MEDHLKKQGTEFFCGNKMTIADICLASESWDWWFLKKMEFVSKCPLVRNWFFRMMGQPGCKETWGAGSMFFNKVMLMGK